MEKSNWCETLGKHCQVVGELVLENEKLQSVIDAKDETIKLLEDIIKNSSAEHLKTEQELYIPSP